MQALVCHALSDNLSGVALAQVASPSPGPGEALVRVHAASINFPDILMCQGRYQFRPEPPFVVGMDFAGTVEALGPDALGPAAGSPVMGGARQGAFADLCVASAAGLSPIPTGWSFAEAAAFPAAALTAYVALVRRGRLEQGETLLVHGAAGGVGLACVQLGLQWGARVIACATSPEKRAFLERLGVTAALPSAGFREPVLDLTNGRGADVVFDPVGGDVFDESLRVTAFDGRLLVIGFTSGRIATVPSNIPLIKGFSIVGVRAGEYGRRFPERGAENRTAILTLAQAGHLRPHLHATLPLARATEAMRLLMNRSVIGKVALSIAA